MPPQGTRVGPYALDVQIGRVEGCTIWHAARADGKARGPTRVAIRLLDDPADPAAQARLEREYQRLRALDGAGAPKAFAHYAGLGALVMEPRRGATVRALLDAALAATLDLDEVTTIEIALGAARVLRHAHQLQEPLVHGRLGPADVLLGKDATVTLTGWGAWGPHPWPPGLAPELRRGERAGPSADQYALGALLASTLEPRLAQDEGVDEAARRIARRWPPAGRLLEHLLASDPAGRYPDLGPVAGELLTLGRQKGGVARIGEMAERCSEFKRGVAPGRPGRPVAGAPLAPPPLPLVPPLAPPTPRPGPLAPLAPLPEPAAPLPEPAAPLPEPAAHLPEPAAPLPEPPAPPHPVGIPAVPAPVEAPPAPAKPAAPAVEEAEPDPGEEPDGDGSMQLIERVALAVIGLLALAALAWLGRACLGG